ncbi:hypothetical protein GCM10010872_08120 [Dyella flava]|nr:hypothetical protein GCM10010872_08120 [Dyella flava]
MTLTHVYPYGYTMRMFTIKQTDEFSKWMKGLRDMTARAKVIVRIKRLAEAQLWGRQAF